MDFQEAIRHRSHGVEWVLILYIDFLFSTFCLDDFDIYDYCKSINTLVLNVSVSCCPCSYCLDTTNSLANDSAISIVQSAVLLNETLSSYVTTHTRKTVNKRRGTKAPVYGSSKRETELQDSNIPLPSAHRALRSTSNQSTKVAKDSRYKWYFPFFSPSQPQPWISNEATAVTVSLTLTSKWTDVF